MCSIFQTHWWRLSNSFHAVLSTIYFHRGLSRSHWALNGFFGNEEILSNAYQTRQQKPWMPVTVVNNDLWRDNGSVPGLQRAPRLSHLYGALACSPHPRGSHGFLFGCACCDAVHPSLICWRNWFSSNFSLPSFSALVGSLLIALSTLIIHELNVNIWVQY